MAKLKPRPSRMKKISLLQNADDPPSKEDLSELSRIINSARRCVVILGAGVSVSSGLPDFRSPDGLFKLLVKKYPKTVVNGRDLFDASLFRDPTSTKLFYHFMGEFKELVDIARCTPTHCFLRNLDKRGQLLRCYTQNIDCLEERAGLVTHFAAPKANRTFPEKMDALPVVENDPLEGRFEDPSPSEERTNVKVSDIDDVALTAGPLNVNDETTTFIYDEEKSNNANAQDEIVTGHRKKSQANEIHIGNARTSPKDEETNFSLSVTETVSKSELKSEQSEIGTATSSSPPTPPNEEIVPRTVQLHGNLSYVICTQCRQRGEFDVNTRNAYKQGMAPPCPHCSEAEMVRSVAGMRSKGIGVLRPDVVLYNEFHPMGESIGNLSASDLRKRPDLLLVMGTSLKIPGVRRLVKEMAKSVHSRPSGRSIFVNRTPPVGTEWSDVFDYHVMGDSDVAVPFFEDAQSHANVRSSTTNSVEGSDVPKTSRKRKASPVVIVEGSPKRGKKSSGSAKTKSAGSSKVMAHSDTISLTTRWKSTKTAAKSSATKTGKTSAVQNPPSKSGRRIPARQGHGEG